MYPLETGEACCQNCQNWCRMLLCFVLLITFACIGGRLVEASFTTALAMGLSIFGGANPAITTSPHASHLTCKLQFGKGKKSIQNLGSLRMLNNYSSPKICFFPKKFPMVRNYVVYRPVLNLENMRDVKCVWKLSLDRRSPAQ